MTPSKSKYTRRPLSAASTWNVLRYQPTPCQGNLPEKPCVLGSNGPAMAQSCGSRTAVHAESSNSGASAPAGSPLVNFQSGLKLITCRPDRSAPGTADWEGSA